MADCAPFGAYSFKLVTFSIDGKQVLGFAEGDDAILVEPAKELGTPVIGADGSSILSISASQAFTVTLKLLPTSPFNAFLMQKVKLARGAGIVRTFIIGFVDTTTGESGGCTTAFVQTEPRIQHGEKATDREWKIFCPCWQPSVVTYAA